MPPEEIERVVVVGGGDAGLMTALTMLSKNDGLSVTVIDDFSEPIPEVGKSTTNYILKSLHDVLDIDRKRFISKVKPVWKASVYFQDWCGSEPFHVPFDDASIRPKKTGAEGFEALLYRHNNRNFRTWGVELAEQRKSPFSIQSSGNIKAYQHVAYHLSVNRFNEFLRTICRERGVDLVDDRIIEVGLDGSNIDAVHSENSTYGADLYIDATGFKRVLISELGHEFRDFDYPLDSAVVSKAEVELSDIVPATLINSAENGWFWQIDTYDWRDLGYVYSSRHTSDEEAGSTFLKEHPAAAESGIQTYRFETGYFIEPWQSNCIPVGNALGFIEPLQSTALVTNALLVEKLSRLLAEHHRLNHVGIRNLYNTYVRSIWENIHEFIMIHYRFADGDTEFWRDMRDIEDTNAADRFVTNFHENGFNSHQDFNQWQFTHENLFYRVFTQWQFYRVLRSLGIESRFYDDIDVRVRDRVKERIDQQTEDQASGMSDHLSYEDLEEYGIY